MEKYIEKSVPTVFLVYFCTSKNKKISFDQKILGLSSTVNLRIMHGVVHSNYITAIVLIVIQTRVIVMRFLINL